MTSSLGRSRLPIARRHITRLKLGRQQFLRVARLYREAFLTTMNLRLSAYHAAGRAVHGRVGVILQCIIRIYSTCTIVRAMRRGRRLIAWQEMNPHNNARDGDEA